MKVGDLVSFSDDASRPLGIVVRLIEGRPWQVAHVLAGGKVVSRLAKDLWVFYDDRRCGE